MEKQTHFPIHYHLEVCLQDYHSHEFIIINNEKDHRIQKFEKVQSLTTFYLHEDYHSQVCLQDYPSQYRKKNII